MKKVHPEEACLAIASLKVVRTSEGWERLTEVPRWILELLAIAPESLTYQQQTAALRTFCKGSARPLPGTSLKPELLELTGRSLIVEKGDTYQCAPKLREEFRVALYGHKVEEAISLHADAARGWSRDLMLELGRQWTRPAAVDAVPKDF